MRFGVIAAAVAAFVCAGQAQAATIITQSFDSTFSRYGSRGPIQIGNLNLTNQIITSAVISFRAGQSVDQDIFTQNPSNVASFSYSGSAGFLIQGPSLAVPAGVSVAYSGTNQCTLSSCSAGIGTSGDYIIPQADLAAFAGTSYIQISALVDLRATVIGAGVSQTARTSNAFASGTITYLIADVAAVPETATWSMMILGIGAVGAGLRRRNRTSTVAAA